MTRKISQPANFIILLFALVVCGASLQALELVSEEWTNSIEGPEAEINIKAKTSGQPAIVWEDVSRKGIPVEEVRIGGVYLGKRILSGSKLTIYPDRLGTWEYDFGMRRLPDEYSRLEKGKRSEYLKRVYPFNKHVHDPVTPFKRVQDCGTVLNISFHHRRDPKICYPVDFGPDFEVVGLILRPWAMHPDGTGRAGTGRWMKPDKENRYTLEAVISEDEAGEKAIARQAYGRDQVYSGKPFYFTLPGISSFYVTLRQSQGIGSHLAGGGIKAFLRYKGKNWPFLRQGGNTLNYSEKGGMKAERSIMFSLNRTSPWPGFSGDLSGLDLKSANCKVEMVSPSSCPDALINKTGILRLSAAEGFSGGNRKFHVYFGLPEEYRDLGNIRAFRITYRVPTSCGRLQLGGTGVYGDKAHPRHISLGAPEIVRATKQSIPYWTFHEKIIPMSSLENMRNVRAFYIDSWGPTWATRDHDNFCIEIGALDLIPFGPGMKESAEKREQEIVTWKAASEASPIFRRLKDKPLPRGPAVNPREFFARGVWGMPMSGTPKLRRIGCKDIWEYREKILDDLKAHHLNAFHFSCYGDHGEDLENFVKFADEKGFHLWGAGPVLLPRDPTVCRIKWPKLKEELARRLEKWKEVPTWLAWAITEEPDMSQLPYLKESRLIMADIGNPHPQIIIYNKENVLLNDASADPGPGGVAFDTYPILIYRTMLDRYVKILKTTWEGAKKCGGVAWFVPQLVEGGSWRAPTQAEMRFQVWTAVAYNVKGFFPFLYDGAKNPDFSDKPFYRYYGEEMARLEALEKLLIAIERNDGLNLLGNIEKDFLVGNFIDRTDRDFRFAIVVNRDTQEIKKFYIKPKRHKDVIIKVSAKSGKITLERIAAESRIEFTPGDGQVFFIGEGKIAEKLLTKYKVRGFFTKNRQYDLGRRK